EGRPCLRHRQRRFGDEPEQRRPPRRGVPEDEAPARGGQDRVADLDRQGAEGARLRAEVPVARQPQGRQSGGEEEVGVVIFAWPHPNGIFGTHALSSPEPTMQKNRVPYRHQRKLVVRSSVTAATKITA